MERNSNLVSTVMPRFMRGIHVLAVERKTWMARTSRAMTFTYNARQSYLNLSTVGWKDFTCRTVLVEERITMEWVVMPPRT